MRRTMALRDFLQVERVALTSGSPMATVSMPLANDFRLLFSGDPSGLTVLFRNVKELATQGADPTDRGAGGKRMLGAVRVPSRQRVDSGAALGRAS
jgi:hypothetical protein